MANNDEFRATQHAETRPCASSVCHGAMRSHWITVAHDHGNTVEVATCLTCRFETLCYNGRLILQSVNPYAPAGGEGHD